MLLSPRRALLGALLTTATTALLVVPPLSGGQAVAADASAPLVGSCHAMTYPEAAARTDPDPAIECGRYHTSRTYAVPTVPAGVDMTDVEALARVVTRKCDPAYAAAVNPKVKARLLSSYIGFWFAPTAAQIRAGARWVRCDLALAGGRSLAPLPTTVRTPAVHLRSRLDSEARCYLGRDVGYALTVCSRPHKYTVVKVFRARAMPYPSRAALFRIAERGCRRAAGPGWITFNPSREQWRAGFRYFVCAEHVGA